MNLTTIVTTSTTCSYRGQGCVSNPDSYRIASLWLTPRHDDSQCKQYTGHDALRFHNTAKHFTLVLSPTLDHTQCQDAAHMAYMFSISDPFCSNSYIGFIDRWQSNQNTDIAG